MKRAARLFLVVLLAVTLLLGAVGIMPSYADGKTVKTKKVTLSPSKSAKLSVGETLTITATLKPADSTQKVKWSSSNKKVATVQGGVVTAKKEGTATITAKSGSKKASIKIKVTDPNKATSVKLNVKGTVKLGLKQTMTLTATMTPASATSKLTWSSSDKKIATVKNGVVTGKKKGTATITVKTSSGKKASVKVKVVSGSTTADPTPAPADAPSPRPTDSLSTYYSSELEPLMDSIGSSMLAQYATQEEIQNAFSSAKSAVEDLEVKCKNVDVFTNDSALMSSLSTLKEKVLEGYKRSVNVSSEDTTLMTYQQEAASALNDFKSRITSLVG